MYGMVGYTMLSQFRKKCRPALPPIHGRAAKARPDYAAMQNMQQ